MKTFYKYDKSTRKPTGKVQAETRPKYATKWAPPSEDHYFDGIGWVPVNDLGLDKDQLIEVILNANVVDTEYSAAESATFAYQVQEAELVQAGDKSNLVFLPQALAKGESLEDLAAKVLAKHKEFLVTVATQRKTRKELEQKLNQLTEEQLQILVSSPQLLPVLT